MNFINGDCAFHGYLYIVSGLVNLFCLLLRGYFHCCRASSCSVPYSPLAAQLWMYRAKDAQSITRPREVSLSFPWSVRAWCQSLLVQVKAAKQVATVAFSNKESSRSCVANNSLHVEGVAVFSRRGNLKCHRDSFLQVSLCCDF